MKEELFFTHALRRSDGLFYNGNAYSDHRDWTDHPQHIYRYTENGAYRKKDLFPCFASCEVVKLND